MRPEPKVGQDEIVVDIDESELEIVRDEFGEIDEFDDFTLTARRRGVLDTLAEEVELEDLTQRDREEPAAAAEPAGADGDAAGDDADGEGDEEPDGEGEGDAAAGDEDPARRKRRRRRRKKKKVEPEPPQPALMVPPHKDFWEVWASHFSYTDFEDPEQPEPEPEPEHVSHGGFDRSAPVPEGEWVTVRLTIGRAHARKAADVRDLLADRTGLSGKAVKNLTVREHDTELQVAASAWPRLARAFTGAPIEGIAVSAELVIDENAAIEAPAGSDEEAEPELAPAAAEPEADDAVEPAPAT